MTTIQIGEEFADDRVTRAAGERLRDRILEARETNQAIAIDFFGVVVASVAFFDEGLAKLADHGWTAEDVKTWIALKNMNPHDRRILDLLCRDRFPKRSSVPVWPDAASAPAAKKRS